MIETAVAGVVGATAASAAASQAVAVASTASVGFVASASMFIVGWSIAILAILVK